MTAIAALYNVPSTEDELHTWAFAHAAHHRDINRVIFETMGIFLPEYVLDPINTSDAYTWIYQHQLMHQAFDPILNIAGYDLLDVDLTDRNELAGWIFLNANEHYQAAQILEIG